MIPRDLEKLLRKHRAPGVVLDSNLLVLLVIGLASPVLIATSRPTHNRAFTVADFNLLLQVVQRAGKLVTTPHILAETSNLLDQVKGRGREEVLQQFSDHLKAVCESHVAAVELIPIDCFFKLGLTDCGIVHLAGSRHLTITVDAPLALELSRLGRPVLNFNHVRPALRGIG